MARLVGVLRLGVLRGALRLGVLRGVVAFFEDDFRTGVRALAVLGVLRAVRVDAF